MKKILLIPWAIAIMIFYILYCDKVKASSTDITYQQDIKIWDEVQIYNSTANPLCTNGSSNFKSCTWEKWYTFNYNYIYNINEPQYLLFRYTYFYGYNQANNDNNIITNMQPSASIVGSTGTKFNCQIENGLIICPLVPNITYTSLYLKGTFIGDILDINIRWQIDNWATRVKNIIIGSNNQIQGEINSQTQQQQQQHNEIMNQNQTYTDETNTNINGANETIEYEEAEGQLLESIDINESIMDDIFINAQASAFIWDIADRLRQMNPAIIILMTSILGIGIFKLILNR